MTELVAYRDDGPLARWIAARIAPTASGPGRLAWLVPPLLRLLEYGWLITLTGLADPDATPLCFAVLAVLAFHHYDIVYRLRYQGVTPPAWIQNVGAGWDGRLLLVSAVAAAGLLRPALLAVAVGLGVVYVTESTASWVRFGRAGGPALHAGEGANRE